MTGGNSMSFVIQQNLNGRERKLLGEFFLLNAKGLTGLQDEKIAEVVELAEKIKAGWNGK